MGGPGSGRYPTVGIAAMTPEQKAAYQKQQQQKYKRHFEQTGRPYTDPGDQKICAECKEPKHISEFRQHPSGQLFKRCIPCNLSFRRDKSIRKQYGISAVEYDALFVDAACEICGDAERLVLDHCHTLNKLRGILCSPCNQMLGLARDDPHVLEAAIYYLRK